MDERFHPGPKPTELLSRYGLSGKTVLLTVSRLAAAERYKGHDRVIKALAQLLPVHPDLVYVIAGDGDDRQHLEMLAESEGVREDVRFVGYVSDEELPDLYRAADVFVMPSTGEGFGIVFLQALASGLSVIAGDGDGSSDPLRDGGDGVMVSAEEPSAIVNAIETTLRKAGGTRPPRLEFERSRYEALVGSLLGGLDRP